MKRVGILTFVDTINFGASLQAYATQELLRQHGYDAEIIPYTNEKIDKKEHNQGSLNLKKIMKSMVMGKGIKNKTIKFKKFETENFKTGMRLCADTKEKVDLNYDYFVVGSDQVWNADITGYDWTYFLDFVSDDRKKIAYAPSIGSCKYKVEAYDKVKKYTSKFQSLSIREESGAKFIKEVTGLSAEVVVDPTLLLDKAEWRSKITFVPEIKDYILVYFPHNKANVFAFVDRLKEKTKLPVIYLSISPRKQKGVTTIYDASPEEFLGWVMNATYIVTGSFHGTAFSLNFEKQFFFESYDDGSRIGNIAKLAGVTERNIMNENALDSMIDFESVNSRLIHEREKSKNWLLRALEQ